jgi:3-oxoacyl-[acyl-carrier-protein] synthase II
VTGAGLVTALGLGWEANAAGFRAGLTAFRPVTLFDVSRQRVKLAGEVDLPATLPSTGLSSRQEQRLERGARLLLWAGHEAWKTAKLGAVENIPVVLGTSSGGMSLGESFYRQAISSPAVRKSQAARVVHYHAQRQGLDLCDAYDFSGPITIIANACASGSNAIGHAWQLLRSGQADCALAGGYDGLSQMVFAGFDALQALSPTECRPFDVARDGLALGEGAAVLILETLEHAEQRGASILGQICGYGASTDVHHLTQPQPEGEAAFRSMAGACREAGIHPSEVGYINAHGTGTRLNDSAEAAAINRLMDSSASSLPVSSTKASIGHLLGAAGSVESVICLMVLAGQWLPPTATTRNPDPLCGFQLVRGPQDASFEYALSNSFGFGGANASLLFKRWT